MLIVDDDEGLLELGIVMLRHLKHEALVARNGIEAEAIALAEKPDVVLLDILMPIQDGYETLRNLRESGYRGTIIMSSALLPAIVKKRLKEMDQEAEYLPKPFSVAKLRSLLETRVG